MTSQGSSSGCGAGCGCGCCAGTQVDTPVPVANRPGLPAIADRAGDYGGFLSSMRARLSSPAYPALARLTARDTGDPAIALLDGWAIVADVLTFYTERLANEGYLRTATQDQSLRLLGRLVGYTPRPGVAADAFLSYTLDKDPTGQDTTVTIPRGSRAQSVPAPGQDAQSFESSDDLLARWSWNDLQVLMRRPVQITAAQLPTLPQVNLAGAGTGLLPGGRLLFVFGTEPGMQQLLTASQVTVDPAANVTVVSQAVATPPPLTDLTAAYRALFDDPALSLAEMSARSRIVRRFADEPMARLRDQPGGGITAAAFGQGLDQLLQELDETAGLAAPYPGIHAWLTGTLRPRIAVIRAQVARIEALPASPASGDAAVAPRNGRRPATDPVLLALAAVIPALRRPPSPVPASAAALARDPARLYAPGSDTGPQLLAALDPRIRGSLYQAWGKVDITEPSAVQEVQAMRVVANPFGATAPLQIQYDSQGRVIGHVEWPLTGSQTLDIQLSYDGTGTTPQSASLTYTSAAGSWPLTRDLTVGPTIDADLGPGHVQITLTPPAPPPVGLAAALPPSSAVFVFTGFTASVLNRSVFAASPADAGAALTVTVQDGADPLTLSVPPGATVRGSQDGLQVTAQRQGPPQATPASLDVSLQAPLGPADTKLLTLDATYDGIAPGSWVVIQRPRKGRAGPGGIPADHGTALAFVATTVTGVQVVSRADFGITGKVTTLTLAQDWLDGQDTLLSDIRDATVYARGEPLQLATEPITDDVGGDQIELAQDYDGLTPGRWVAITGERSDIPGTTGVPGAELSMIAAVEQKVCQALPGDTVHAVITLAAPLAYIYRRASVHVYANVAHATQGATRDEAIGSGDASQTGQTFTLFQGPLTWVAAANPLGAASTLEVRVDGVLWREVGTFAGQGPGDRVYVTSLGDDGKVRVTFGDGAHGARLPTGQENVRAHYRFGVGSAGNVAAGQISQLTSRPLGVSGVSNPLPAAGGADPDDAAQLRRGIPLSVTALDRLVGLPDYEDFARGRAGIGRASARQLSDGSRQIVHVTVAGAGDIPLADDSSIITDLAAALAAFGDPQLPVAVAVREAVLLVIVASVRAAAGHPWEVVVPQIQAALVARFGFAARELAQPAYLSEAVTAIQAVPGVDYVDVTGFAGVPDTITPAGLQGLAAAVGTAAGVVRARPARFGVTRYTVTDPGGESLAQIAARNGITVAELMALNPGLADVKLPPGTSVVVFRGIRPAQLVMLSPAVPETLILTEAPS